MLATIFDRKKEILDDKIRAGLDLTQIVNDLAGVMKEFEAMDDMSFGITTMWIKECDEIPNFLRRVRQIRLES
jgi:hypothetical protein